MAYTPDISKFINNIGNVQRAYLYFVHIELPAVMTNGGVSETTRVLNFLAQKVNFPSREIEIAEWRHAGRIRSVPTYCLYPPTQFTFLCDEQMRAKKMLDAWQSNIIEPVHNYVQYYDKFVGKCEVISMSTTGGQTYKVRFNEFFPSRVDEVVFDGSANNTFATVEAEFRFRDWYNGDTIKNLPQGLSNEVQNILDGFGVGDELESVYSEFSVPNVDVILSNISGNLSQIINQFANLFRTSGIFSF